MENLFNFAMGHWSEILLAIVAFQHFAERIAALTPATWDDKLIGKLASILNILAMVKKQ